MENFILIGLFVGLGSLFRRIKAFPDTTAQALNMFALYVSLPAVILLKVPQLHFTAEMLVPALLPWAMLLLSAALVLLVGRRCGWPRPIIGVLLLVVPIGNTSFMGVPMVNAYFGEAGIPYLITYDQLGTMLMFASYGTSILAIYGKEGSLRPLEVVRRMLLFPTTLALLAGLLLSPWRYPPELVKLLTDIGKTLTPLVMTAIGFQLRLRQQRTVIAPLAFGLGVKLAIAPLAALLICRLLGLQGLGVDVSIFEAGMPPMVTAGALAIAAGIAPDLAAALVSLGIPLAFGTLSLLYLLI